MGQPKRKPHPSPLRGASGRPSLARAAAMRAGILCPKWVPWDLVDEFWEVAAVSGEFAAAKHIRQLKREMEMANG